MEVGWEAGGTLGRGRGGKDNMEPCLGYMAGVDEGSWKGLGTQAEASF